MLCEQQPLLASYLRSRYDGNGAKLFEDANRFYTFSRVLKKIIYDDLLQQAYIVVDALDEFIASRDQLVRFTTQHAIAFPRVKQIASSRNIPTIENFLEIDGPNNSNKFNTSEIKLSLEVTQNARQVTHSVEAFIDYKLSNIRSLQDDYNIRGRVRDAMREKANGTFLRVALRDLV